MNHQAHITRTNTKVFTSAFRAVRYARLVRQFTKVKPSVSLSVRGVVVSVVRYS